MIKEKKGNKMEEKELIEALKLNIAVLENENKILKKQKKIQKKKILNLKKELVSERIIKSFHLKVSRRLGNELRGLK